MIGDKLTDMQFAKKAKIEGYLFNEKNLYKLKNRYDFFINPPVKILRFITFIFT